MQTLFIPENIQIDFFDSENNPIRQEGILIGIKTRANRKNDINLTPFLTDKDGRITITAKDIKECSDNFISYGIMDYSSLESAKPEIEIYLWGKSNLENFIIFWSRILENKTDLKQFEKWGDKLGQRDIESAQIEKREREEFELFKNCHNWNMNIKEDFVLLRDTWDKSSNLREYKVNIEKIKGSR